MLVTMKIVAQADVSEGLSGLSPLKVGESAKQGKTMSGYKEIWDNGRAIQSLSSQGLCLGRRESRCSN